MAAFLRTPTPDLELGDSPKCVSPTHTPFVSAVWSALHNMLFAHGPVPRGVLVYHSEEPERYSKTQTEVTGFPQYPSRSQCTHGPLKTPSKLRFEGVLREFCPKQGSFLTRGPPPPPAGGGGGVPPSRTSNGSSPKSLQNGVLREGFTKFT
jgi:hypothetical protein